MCNRPFFDGKEAYQGSSREKRRAYLANIIAQEVGDSLVTAFSVAMFNASGRAF
jgi:23S rRNA A1618 N6-methylase RlmF